jgi:hypothetical protein
LTGWRRKKLVVKLTENRIWKEFTKVTFGNAVQTAFHENSNFFFLLKFNFLFMVSDYFDVQMSKIIFLK